MSNKKKNDNRYNLPKYQQVISFLLEELSANKFKIGDKFYSENQIAEKFKISPITASKALNFLSEEKLISRRKGSGTYVKKIPAVPSQIKIIENRSIGIITGDVFFESPKSGDVIYHLFKALSDVGFLVNLSCQSVEKLLLAKVDGIITVGSFSDKLVKDLKKSNIPVVGYGPFLKKYFPCVFPDYKEIADIVCSHFYNAGRSRMLFAGMGEDASIVYNEVIAGKKDFLRKYKLPASAVSSAITKGGNIKQILTNRLGRADKPDAIFLMNWLSIRPTLQALAQQNMSVPDDISIIVQGASALDVHTTPVMSAIYPSIRNISVNAVKILTVMLKDGRNKAGNIVVNSMFDQRGSTKKV